MIVNFSNIGSGSGGGSGMTPSQVQAMINTSITGKADTSAVTSAMTEISNTVSGKQDTLVSGTNIKTINGSAITGSGNLVVQGGGSVDTGAVQSYLTAATDSALTGLTGMKEGDICNLVEHSEVVPNSYEQPDGDVNFYDTGWWKDRAGYNVEISFDAEQFEEQLVLQNIEQHNIEYESDDKLEIIIYINDGNDDYPLGISVDSAGTVYGFIDWEWVEVTAGTVSVAVPANVASVNIESNMWDFNLEDPEALYKFREYGSNIKYYYQNGEWTKLDKYATAKDVNEKISSMQGSLDYLDYKINQQTSNLSALTTRVNTLSGSSQTRFAASTTLPTGGSEGDVAILQQVDTGSSSVSAISFSGFVSMLDNGEITPGKSFTFSADTSVTQRMEVGVFYKISGVNHYFQIGCDNTGQWYNILNATNQTKQNWDGSVITFTFPSDATNIAKYLQAGMDNGSLYVEADVYDIVQVPYTMMAGQWEHPVVSNDIYRVVSMSQADYDALSGNTDSHTLYNITGTTS